MVLSECLQSAATGVASPRGPRVLHSNSFIHSHCAFPSTCSVSGWALDMGLSTACLNGGYLGSDPRPLGGGHHRH